MTSEDVAVENLHFARKAPAEAWAVVMYFYAAIHAVNYHRFGLAHVLDSFKHPERQAYVMQSLKAVDAKYRALSSLAHDARYRAEALPFSTQDVETARRLALAIFKGAGVIVPTDV